MLHEPFIGQRANKMVNAVGAMSTPSDARDLPFPPRMRPMFRSEVTMTYRHGDAAAPQPGATAATSPTQLTLRMPQAHAEAAPTVVAATLNSAATNMATVTPSLGQQASTHAAPDISSMPLDTLADRIFRILERRLVAERERRGLRP